MQLRLYGARMLRLDHAHPRVGVVPLYRYEDPLDESLQVLHVLYLGHGGRYGGADRLRASSEAVGPLYPVQIRDVLLAQGHAYDCHG